VNIDQLNSTRSSTKVQVHGQYFQSTPICSFPIFRQPFCWFTFRCFWWNWKPSLWI